MTRGVAPPRNCIACGATPRRIRRVGAGSWLRQCPRCLLGWWDWPPFDAASLYDQSYFQGSGVSKGYDDYAGQEAGLERAARGRARRIERRLAAADGGSRRLVDVGCGTGVFLAAARRAGWDVQGVEVSQYAAQVARDRGLVVDERGVEHMQLAESYYDCVTLWDVLEHLPNPASVLRTAGQALRRGGVLALSTGDVTSLCARLSGRRWHLFNLPEHLFFFSPAALRRLLERAGLRVVDVVREVNWVPVAYMSERLRKSSGLIGRVTARGIDAVASRGGRRGTVPATLLDVIGVYAVRG